MKLEFESIVCWTMDTNLPGNILKHFHCMLCPIRRYIYHIILGCHHPSIISNWFSIFYAPCGDYENPMCIVFSCVSCVNYGCIMCVSIVYYLYVVCVLCELCVYQIHVCIMCLSCISFVYHLYVIVNHVCIILTSHVHHDIYISLPVNCFTLKWHM